MSQALRGGGRCDRCLCDRCGPRDRSDWGCAGSWAGGASRQVLLHATRQERQGTVAAGSSGGPQPVTAPPTTGTARLSAADERTARKELQRLERQLDRLSEREAELTEQLAANATDYEKLTALGADLRAAQAEKADLEERWLAVAQGLE